MGDSERVRVRSYRSVLDSVERRIFHLDRWRLPLPQGVSLRALIYTLAMGLGVLFASRLPLIGAVLGLLPPSALYLGAPILAGWALASLRIDGRPPHHVMRSAVRHAAAPKTLAALRPCPAVGSSHAPIEAIRFAPTGDEPVYGAVASLVRRRSSSATRPRSRSKAATSKARAGSELPDCEAAGRCLSARRSGCPQGPR